MTHTALLKRLPHPEIDADMLDAAIWHCPKLAHLEEVLIRPKADKSLVYKAQFHEEEYTFYLIGHDGEVKPWDYQWRKIFPESVLERAAINSAIRPDLLTVANAQASDIAELVACLRALYERNELGDQIKARALLERIGHE